ncbi:MAG: endonuclease/exonuclease/phosphatase family protein, partial [Candidatus Thiodiazotropha endolucinida]|nr:endonuclease/exonuclease/phosphatase family protein [Candidatus Thiodiazotropha taylori]MCW4264289.1 endonuclease/exonuclease/phosphatase family protein [Candidatus Thiodiazotropha endolucinida]
MPQDNSDDQETLEYLHDSNIVDSSLRRTCNIRNSTSEPKSFQRILHFHSSSREAPLPRSHEKENGNVLNLSSKGINIGHLNIQGICGENLTKFSELKVLLTLPENNNLHIFGLSETKLKEHKTTEVFKINGFQTPFRKDNYSNGGGGILVYVKNGISVRRREDLETNNVPCLWLEIRPASSKSFLVGNMYRPPDSRVEFNDRFEDFIDNIINEEKEYILLGDFNKNLLDAEIDRDWGNFTTSLGLTQLVTEPTRVTNESQTLIDHIYTNTEENIQRVNVERLCLSDHYAIFCNRKSQSNLGKNTHQTITYRSFKNFEEYLFINDLVSVPWEIIEAFDKIDDIVSVWST